MAPSAELITYPRSAAPTPMMIIGDIGPISFLLGNSSLYE